MVAPLDTWAVVEPQDIEVVAVVVDNTEQGEGTEGVVGDRAFPNQEKAAAHVAVVVANPSAEDNLEGVPFHHHHPVEAEDPIQASQRVSKTHRTQPKRKNSETTCWPYGDCA